MAWVVAGHSRHLDPGEIRPHPALHLLVYGGHGPYMGYPSPDIVLYKVKFFRCKTALPVAADRYQEMRLKGYILKLFGNLYLLYL